jgi:tripartite-type tricarboxylate transporter receptor subunit TctC
MLSSRLGVRQEISAARSPGTEHELAEYMIIAARTIGAALLLASISGPTFAQQYPSGPVTIVVPFAPGGTTDILGRLAGEALQTEFKQSVVIENRTGAGGIIGNTSVARAAPDGQTLLFAPTAFSIVPHTSKNVPYDPLRDFKPVSLVGYTHNVMVVAPSMPVNSVQEFIDHAKKSDRPLSYASPGLGTPTQLGAEVFARRTGIKLQHIPYRGAVPSVTALMAGEVSMMFIDLAPALPLIEAGKIKPLGMLTLERHRDLPNVPPVADTVPGFYLMGWQGLFAPGRTPDAIVEKINAPLVKHLKTPEVGERLRRIGVDVKWTTPGEMREWVESQLKHWGEFAKTAGIEPQ